jgi:putative transposon-encoded protein
MIFAHWTPFQATQVNAIVTGLVERRVKAIGRDSCNVIIPPEYVEKGKRVQFTATVLA